MVSYRTDMVVDDVEDDGDPQSVGAVDEAAEINRLSVETSWREKINAIISPTEPAREFRHGHDFEAGYTELGERWKFAQGSIPASLRGKCADMHLVDDEVLARDPAPRLVGPSEIPRIDDFRRSVRSFRLVPRRRVGQCRLALIEAETIAHTGSRRQALQ